jgi:hypothetical protein
VTLILGMLLISERFRLRFPQWHRAFGRIQVPTVLFLVVPSGLWMAYHAMAGTVAGVGFAFLAMLTAICAACGWRAAVQRRFGVHRRWMWRTFLLLCSAVVIRILGGFATVAGIEAAWFDSLTSWVSWLVPLALFEMSGLQKRRANRVSVQAMTTARVE